MKRKLRPLPLDLVLLVSLFFSSFLFAKTVAAETVTVEIKKFEFIPAHLTVKQGTTVRWLNAESRQYHSVWFETLDKEETDYFFPEETYEKTFLTPGTYQYRCGPHERMKGTVVVEGVVESAVKAVDEKIVDSKLTTRN